MSEIKKLRAVLRATTRLVVEHHSYSVMKEEHYICPVCDNKKWDRLMDAAIKLSHPRMDKKEKP
jgi:hypothetical protein